MVKGRENTDLSSDTLCSCVLPLFVRKLLFWFKGNEYICKGGIWVKMPFPPFQGALSTRKETECHRNYPLQFFTQNGRSYQEYQFPLIQEVFLKWWSLVKGLGYEVKSTKCWTQLFSAADWNKTLVICDIPTACLWKVDVFPHAHYGYWLAQYMKNILKRAMQLKEKEKKTVD